MTPLVFMRATSLITLIVCLGLMCSAQSTGRLVVQAFPLNAVVTLDGDTIENQHFYNLEPGDHELSATSIGKTGITETVTVIADSTVKWQPSLIVSSAASIYLVDYEEWRKKKVNSALLKTSLVTFNAAITAIYFAYLPTKKDIKKEIKAVDDMIPGYIYEFDPVKRELAVQEYRERKNEAQKNITKKYVIIGVGATALIVSYGLTVYAWKKLPKIGPKPLKKDYGLVENFKFQLFPNIDQPMNTQVGISFNF